jgi:hypothetical protein
VFQTSSGEDRESLNDPAETLAQNQALEVCYNSLPFVVIGVGQSFQRQLGGKETIFWRNSVVAENGDGREHCSKDIFT